MKVLVIDDDEEILPMLKMFFEMKGHLFRGATTASGGVADITMNQPDVVFLDINLPDEDGIVTLKKIKAINELIPVVMITAYKSAEKVIESFRYGAMDCLLKPINFDYLENKILIKISG
jgi:DNA-binding response OmpR family regulator